MAVARNLGEAGDGGEGDKERGNESGGLRACNHRVLRIDL